MNENSILKGYEYAKEAYAAAGVDVDAAIKKADAIPVSMHCWQGDDVIGLDGADGLAGGIQTTPRVLGGGSQARPGDVRDRRRPGGDRPGGHAPCLLQAAHQVQVHQKGKGREC